MKDFVLIALGSAIIGISVALVGHSDYNAEKEDERMYCEMVGIYKESGGQYGWPPYNSSINCKE